MYSIQKDLLFFLCTPTWVVSVLQACTISDAHHCIALEIPTAVVHLPIFLAVMGYTILYVASRKMRSVKDVKHMGYMRNAYRNESQNLKGQNKFRYMQ
jgi:hypothetical protein